MTRKLTNFQRKKLSIKKNNSEYRLHKENRRKNINKAYKFFIENTKEHSLYSKEWIDVYRIADKIAFPDNYNDPIWGELYPPEYRYFVLSNKFKFRFPI